MRVPRDIHGTDAVKALRRLGYASVRQTGSHHITRRDNRTVVVPMHKPIKPGTLRSLLEQAAVSLEDFLDAL